MLVAVYGGAFNDWSSVEQLITPSDKFSPIFQVPDALTGHH